VTRMDPSVPLMHHDDPSDLGSLIRRITPKERTLKRHKLVSILSIKRSFRPGFALVKEIREPHEVKKKSFDLGGNRTHDLRIRSTIKRGSHLRHNDITTLT